MRTPARLAVVCAALAVLGLLALVDPASSALYPPCPVHALTGLSCPGCGSLRATHALLHGRVAAAAALNPLMVALLGAALLLAVTRRAGPRVRTRAVRVERVCVALLPWVVVAYAVARNVPVWPLALLAPH